ncbi:MAG: hypothetical protein ACYTDU_11770 [Planctomycetota bacterium]
MPTASRAYALELSLGKTHPQGEIVYEIVGNVVRLIKREHARQ